MGYEPPAAPGALGPSDDDRMKSAYVSQILMRKPLITIESRIFVQEPELLHARMRELRDRWYWIGEVEWPGWRLWHLKSFIYVRRDSKNAARLIEHLGGVVKLEPDKVRLDDIPPE